jgi:hypothetical protein
MPKQPRLLPVESILFASGGLRPREMPKTVYKGILLKLTINHTNGAGPVITADSFLNILTKLNLTINGQDQLLSVPLRQWFYQNNYDFSRLAAGNQVSLFTTGSATGNSIFYAYVPLGLTRSLNPEDTILDARAFKSLVMEANWGTTIGTGVTTINSGQLDMFPDEYANVAEDFAGARHEMNLSSRNLDATGARTLELETKSNNQYRRLWIYTRDNTGALSDVQIDNIIVRSRSFNYVNIKADVLQRYNGWEYARDHQTGLYVIDFTRDGKMTQRIDARELSELIIEVNSLVANGTMEVVKEKAIYA